MREKLKKLLGGGKIKGKDGMIIILLVGALLAVIAIPTEKKQEEDNVLEEQSVAEIRNYDDYATQLENRLEEILSCMEGVGKVEVMITLQASSREVVEKDWHTQQDSNTVTDGSNPTNHITKEENTVYSEDGNASIPYVVQEIYPEIEGVLVVAEGGGNSYINIAITDAIQALFGVDVHKIKIVKMNTN